MCFFQARPRTSARWSAYLPLRFWEPDELSVPFDCLTSTVGVAVEVAVVVALTVVDVALTVVDVVFPEFEVFLPELTVAVAVAVVLPPELASLALASPIVVKIAPVIARPEMASAANW